MNQLYEKILDAAIRAPSGDNSQPWMFRFANDDLLIYLLSERDTSLYNFNQTAALVSHGAVIENIDITACKLGYKPSIQICYSNYGESRLVAKIHFEKLNLQNPGLYDNIFTRCTNRKPYKKLQLAQTDIDALASVADGEGCKILLVAEKEKIALLAEMACNNEKVLFENPYLHKFFFEHVIWKTNDELKNPLGFYVKTLEIPALAMPMFKLAKKWSTLLWLNKFGFSNMIAKANKKTYAASSVIGAIITPGTSFTDYINAGRSLQKIWLTADNRKLSFQILAGTTFLAQRIAAGQTKELNEKHIKLITNSYKKIQELFETSKNVVLMFRIGYGGQPSARTLRMPVKII